MSIGDMLTAICTFIGIAIVVVFAIRGVDATISDFRSKKKTKSSIDEQFDSIVRE